MASLKDNIKNGQVQPKQQQNPSKPGAASTLMELPSYKKDEKITIRINQKLYREFKDIVRKQGSTMSSVINMMIAKYVMENQNILDQR